MYRIVGQSAKNGRDGDIEPYDWVEIIPGERWVIEAFTHWGDESAEAVFTLDQMRQLRNQLIEKVP